MLDGDAPVILYVGKLIHSKGVHCLLSAFARVRHQTTPEAKLLVIGYDTFREGLEALTLALSTGNHRVVELPTEGGRLFEGGTPSAMEHFEVTDALLRDAEGMAPGVEFVGPLYHAGLARVLPAAEVAVVPSIFPETFGLVAAEAGAASVPPFVANHSGLREAGGFVGRGLPFRHAGEPRWGPWGQPGPGAGRISHPSERGAATKSGDRAPQQRRGFELGRSGRAYSGARK